GRGRAAGRAARGLPHERGVESAVQGDRRDRRRAREHRQEQDEVRARAAPGRAERVRGVRASASVTMDCEKFETAMMDELYGELDELTSAAAKRHMAGCARCSALLGGLRATRRVASIPP